MISKGFVCENTGHKKESCSVRRNGAGDNTGYQVAGLCETASYTFDNSAQAASDAGDSSQPVRAYGTKAAIQR